MWRTTLGQLVRLFRRFPIFKAQPPSAAIKRAEIIAFVASHPQHAAQWWIWAAKRRGATIDILSLTDPVRRADGQLTSFVSTAPRTRYECVVVSDDVQLFEHSWSYAFLDRLNALAAPGGAIVVPTSDDADSGIPKKRLVDLFGGMAEEETASHLTFKKAPNGLNRPSEAAHSTLDAYWPLMDTLTHGKFDPKLADIVRVLGVRSGARPPPNKESDFALLRKQAYRTCSARTKAAIVEYIVSFYFPGRSGLRMVDLGAGTGLNSLELLLNPGSVSTLTLVEPRRGYHWHIAAVIEQVRAQLNGPVFIVDRKVEEYDGPRNDIGLVCGVLVMVPKTLREKFVVSAWNNLAPSGILMVLENMRHSGAATRGKYYDQRCTPREIDSLLRRFAPIRYFMSTAKREIPFRRVGNDSVFRVIQKPS